jgi:hypothetical protein
VSFSLRFSRDSDDFNSRFNASGDGLNGPPEVRAEPFQERVPAGPDLTATARAARALLCEQSQRGADGRFVASNVDAGGTLAHSEQFWALVEPACRETAGRVRADLGLADGEASEIQIGLIDNYVQARLLRESLWASLVDRGGPVTGKGNSRRVLAEYWKASDRERDRAQLLGLERRSRTVRSIAEAIAAAPEAR